MNRSWSLKDLREYVIQECNKDQDLLDLLSSIDHGIDIFRYHFSTARDALTGFFDSDAKAHREHVERVIGVSEDQEEFQLAKIANEANTIAAIYTVRSVFDLFSQLTRGLLLEDKLSKEACNIYRVRDHLEEGDLRTAIERLLKSDGFRYINAFVNVTKHRSLVKYGSLVDFVNDKAGVRFSAFEYRKEVYPKLWSEEILEKILTTKNEIVAAGIALNDRLIPQQA
ncbi:hypothetical protein C9993_00710 [Marinobacter sp. Z-F4-2]|nr:hypothetical protein C9993_00710 [Marinobacter sp. Z-F4-2]|tara:strand:+ start:3127 stop:3804 length:678 start_codon:yes stop_codon:yes gene_type:complete